MIVFKNIFSFGLTLKAFEWLVQNQTKATPLFNAIGSVQVAVCVLSIPMCKLLLLSQTWLRLQANFSRLDVFGKRIRSFFHRHDILDMLNLR
jgi:hypothetical protein